MPRKNCAKLVPNRFRGREFLTILLRQYDKVNFVPSPKKSSTGRTHIDLNLIRVDFSETDCDFVEESKARTLKLNQGHSNENVLHFSSYYVLVSFPAVGQAGLANGVLLAR